MKRWQLGRQTASSSGSIRSEDQKHSFWCSAVVDVGLSPAPSFAPSSGAMFGRDPAEAWGQNTHTHTHPPTASTRLGTMINLGGLENARESG